MDVNLIIIAATAPFIALLVNPATALSNEACKQEFRELVLLQHEGYPYEATGSVSYRGNLNKIALKKVGRYSHIRYMNFAGRWLLRQGRDEYQSTNQGETWKLLITHSKSSVQEHALNLKKQTKTIRNVTCTNNVNYNGKAYRLVEGSFIATTTAHSGLTTHQYYMSSPRGPQSTWATRISKGKVGGAISVLIQTKTRTGDGVVVPTVGG